MVSSLLYEKRFGPFFVEPIIAGLTAVESKDDEGKVTVSYEPYITAMDLIGAGVDTTDFVVGGTSSEELYGVCEAMYRPNLPPEDLFETISQCLLAAVDRDCLAGWGAVVHVMSVLSAQRITAPRPPPSALVPHILSAPPLTATPPVLCIVAVMSLLQYSYGGHHPRAEVEDGLMVASGVGGGVVIRLPSCLIQTASNIARDIL